MPKFLAIIPARGGSKGLLRKNLREASGRPLIAWTILAAQSSTLIDHTVLSSDDNEIITAAKQWNCDVPFKRPANLAQDTTSSLEVVLHAISELPGFDYVVLLQPTSPLRSSDDIDSAISLMIHKGAQSCVSLCETSESPFLMRTIREDGSISNVVTAAQEATRRQDLPSTYLLNGAIYIAQIDWLLKNNTFLNNETIGFVMPKDRSIDIDSLDDFNRFKEVIEK